MHIENLYPGLMASNCYLLTVGEHAAVIDPSAQAETILQRIAEKGATLDFILLTHGHFDHVTSLSSLREKSGAKVFIHSGDFEMPNNAYQNFYFQFFGKEETYGLPDEGFEDGHIFKLGDQEIVAYNTPGHSKGSCCFLCNNQFLITGDTLFADTFGRYDGYGASFAELRNSLRFLMTFPANMTIYPGHGNSEKLGIALQTIISH